MTNDPSPLPFDRDFADAARRAALAFGTIAKTLQAESDKGVTRALIDRLLRSGRSIGSGECEVLADLISGELCRPAGRRRRRRCAS